jgi:serine/threonine-protein kinase
MSPLDPQRLIAGQPTGPYQQMESIGRPAAEIEVARTPDGGPGIITDVRTLLHKRLRFLATLLFGAMAAVLTLFAVVLLLTNQGKITEDSALDFLITLLLLALPGILAAILWLRPSLTLRQLRVIELIFFGMLFAHWTWMHASVYPRFRLDDPPIWFASVMAHAVSVPWVFMIVLYGIFIPNTARRCAAVVAVMALAPLFISSASGLAAEGHAPGSFLITVGVWMAMAAAIATYGAYRIEVLRREVLSARRLGPYQLRHCLGAGGMGEVYLANHTLLRRPCAVKLIRPDRTIDAHSLLRFEREVQATAALTHPNTVQVFDYGHAEDGTFYYAMEYLPGLNLEQLVQRYGPLPPKRAVYLLRQVCGALREAHAVGLIHRDLKPSNIIACQRGGMQDVAKLLDFGLVQTHGDGERADHRTLENTIAGTPAYMSPEQANAQQNLDARSDIYSLGAVSYFLLTGQPPFVRSTPYQTLLAHLHDRAIPIDQFCPNVPADLQRVVLRCLEKDPARRFTNVQQMERALTDCQLGTPWTEEQPAAWWQTRSVTGLEMSATADVSTTA